MASLYVACHFTTKRQEQARNHTLLCRTWHTRATICQQSNRLSKECFLNLPALIAKSAVVSGSKLENNMQTIPSGTTLQRSHPPTQLDLLKTGAVVGGVADQILLHRWSSVQLSIIGVANCHLARARGILCLPIPLSNAAVTASCSLTPSSHAPGKTISSGPQHIQ